MSVVRGRAFLVVCCVAAVVRGDEPPAAGNAAATEFFEARIRPVLVEHCLRCHGEEAKGGLRLDSRAAMRVGGESGPAVVPGKPEESLVVKALAHDGLEMPPDGRLSERVAADFADWIRDGAFDPRDAATTVAVPAAIDVEAGRSFWAFRPPVASSPPAVADTAWPWCDIDRFVLAGLEARGLVPAADADRATWLRRVTFDLVGLPPTIAELDAFLADSGPDPFAAVVDRLLASPRFGERWGRHWLDVARYAESSGGGRSVVFKEAWRYRDYVVAAFNADMPFDRFIVAQIAGDLLPHESPAAEHDHLVATGYLLLGAHNYEEQDKRALEMDVADEQIEAIGRGLLGMTLACARCHDHKFDPIPTSDYYALAGILRSTDVLVHDNVSRWTERQLPLDPDVAAAVAAHTVELAAAREALAAAKRSLESLDPTAGGPIPVAALAGIVIDDTAAQRVGDWTASTSVTTYVGDGYIHDGDAGKGRKTVTFQPRLPAAGRYEVRLGYTPGGNRSAAVPVSLLSLDGNADRTVDMKTPPPIDGRFISLGTFRFDDSDQWFVRVSNEGTTGHVIVDCVQFLPLDGTEAPAAEAPPAAAGAIAAAKAEVDRLTKQVAEIGKRAPAVPRAMAVADAAEIGDAAVRIRGNVHARGDVVPRGVISVATTGAAPPMPSDASGRRELADWIAHADNPLTSRVWVNRVWAHCFGAGLVRTVDTFGAAGEPPSHPELLDTLALRFTAEGWSTKRLLRAIVLSHVYRQSCGWNPRAAEIDPDNRLLWRAHRRRLDAEALRDAVMQVSGQLDLRAGGPGIDDPSVLEKAGGDVPTEYGYRFTDRRRSVYTPAFRNRRHELFEAFDGADPNAVTGSRNESTVAPQALFVLNGPFLMDAARAAAERTLSRPAARDGERLDVAFREAVGRPPSTGEREAALATLGVSEDDPAKRLAAWERIHQALFGSIDFRHLD